MIVDYELKKLQKKRFGGIAIKGVKDPNKIFKGQDDIWLHQGQLHSI